MATREPLKTYQLKITLDSIKPLIWRRILVTEKITLFDLHELIQASFGWMDYHLHEYKIRNTSYGDPQDDESGLHPILNETRYSLKKLQLAEGDRFTYVYDFGDDWYHTIEVEKIAPREKNQRLPVCLAGKRACPPEDVGGFIGYEMFLKAIQDPENPEREAYLEWVGGAFDPDEFDLQIINDMIEQIHQHTGFDAPDDDDLLREKTRSVINDPGRLGILQTSENRAAAEALPLRKDVIALITYIRDHKVTGTQSTGNFPRKAIYAIAPLLNNPPVLDNVFNEVVISFTNEYEVWPVFFLHVLCEVSGLIRGGRSRLWRLTENGQEFLAASPVTQVWTLLVFWWFRVNWLIASPYNLFGENMPENFISDLLALLQEIKPGMQVKIDPFVNRLKNNTGWEQSQSRAYYSAEQYKDVIEDIVINPLESFGILEIQCRQQIKFGHTFDLISSFQITPFGQALIQALVP